MTDYDYDQPPPRNPAPGDTYTSSTGNRYRWGSGQSRWDADWISVRAGETRVTDPQTGGEKGQKLERFDLIPFGALEEVARVYGTGAQKYSDDNWRKGYSWRLSLGALLRHVSAWARGESLDPETGHHHLAHAAWHCLTLVTYEQQSLGTDDRAREPDPNTPAPSWAPGPGWTTDEDGWYYKPTGEHRLPRRHDYYRREHEPHAGRAVRAAFNHRMESKDILVRVGAQ